MMSVEGYMYAEALGGFNAFNAPTQSICESQTELASIALTLLKDQQVLRGGSSSAEEAMSQVSDMSIYVRRTFDIESAFDFKTSNNASFSLEVPISLYTRSLLSLGRAAEVAGLPYDIMLEELERRGIPLRLGPSSPEEAEEEEQRFLEFIGRSRQSQRRTSRP